MKSKYVNWRGIVIDTLYTRDSGICHLCKELIGLSAFFEIDHIKQRQNGGRDTIDNLRLVHLACHKKRHQAKRAAILSPRIVRTTKGEVPTLVDSLIQSKGNISQVARDLGVTRKTVRAWMKRFNIK